MSKPESGIAPRVNEYSPWVPMFDGDQYSYTERISYFPYMTEDGSLRIDTYINDILRERSELEEKILTGVVVDALRFKGYVVIEPKESE